MIPRILAGLSLSTAVLLVSVIGQVVAVPIYLTRWGAQVYGEWLTLTNLVSSLSVLNLGVQSYASNRLIACYVRGQREEGVKILHGALRLYLVLCGLGLAATVALIAWPGILTWLQISQTPGVQARIIIGINGMLATYAIMGGLLMSLFRVINQLPRQLGYSLVERVVQIGAPAATAMIGGRPVHASVVAGTLLILVGCIGLRDVARRSPYPLGLSGTSWASSLALVRPSLAFFAVSIATPILLTGMTLAISTTLGAASVAVFGTLLMLTNLVRLVVHQGVNVLWPEITAAAAGEGGRERLATWHRLALKLAGILVVASTAGIILMGSDILEIWTRGRIEMDPWLNLLLVIYLLVQTPTFVSGVFGLATNRQDDLLAVQITTAIISISLCWWLVSVLGLRGAAIALIAGQTVGTVWTMRLACYWVPEARARLLGDVLARALPTMITALLVSIGIWHMLPGIFGHTLGSVAVITIVGLLGWNTWLTRLERDLLSKKIVTAVLLTSPLTGIHRILHDTR